MAAESRFAEVLFCLDIYLTNWLDFTKTIIPLALMGSKSIVDSEPIRARGIIVNKMKKGSFLSFAF